MGMSLENHLETHPKDQVIKALVSAVGITSNNNSGPAAIQQQQPSTGIVYGEFLFLNMYLKNVFLQSIFF